jgi:hypothetical protein
MKTNLTLALAITAGFIGGVLSRYVSPAAVHAQTSPPTVLGAAQTLQLPVFVLNESGAVVASFTMDSDGQPNIKLFDAKPSVRANDETLRIPSVIWSARGAALARR